jgi:two-component system LytT family response regulator/two-component system response regulator LytT
MGAIRTVVVDDEKLARDRLVGFLNGLDDVHVVGQAANGPDALEVIGDTKPDLVYLDVQMPGMNGLDVAKRLNGSRPHVVFATAHDEFAVQAFEVEAIDYVLKPFSRTRVRETVDRARARLDSGTAPDLDALVKRLDRRQRTMQIALHAGKRIFLAKPDDVAWFGVEHRLVYAHLQDRAYMTNYTLRELEEQLDPDVFFRAHKASLVNLTRVASIVPWFGGRFKLVMTDHAESEVAVSRAQARVLRARLRW